MQGFKQVMMYDEVKLTDNINEADALLAVQSKLKKNPRIQDAARSHAIPIYVVKVVAHKFCLVYESVSLLYFLCQKISLFGLFNLQFFLHCTVI